MSVNPRINITTINSIDTKTACFDGVGDYDPTLQRFLSEDPIGFDSGDFNFYGYTWNNPINYTDSSGLIIDTFADIGFMLYDVYSIGRDNIFGNCDNFGTNLAALGADSLAMLIPGVTGGGMAVRAGKGLSKAKEFSRKARTIQDKMTLDAAKRGAGKKLPIKLNDPKYKGMDKMEYKVKSNNGNDSVVHYVRDPKTGKTMDFKFKKHSDSYVP